MAKKFMVVSDLTGDPIQDEKDVVTIVLYDHPLIEQPVQLDADSAEVSELDSGGKDYAVFEVLSDGGDKRERYVLELADFDNLFRTNVDDVLKEAEPYRQGYEAAQAEAEPRRRGRPRGSGSAAPKADKVNYKELPWAGREHRGRTSPEEAEVVRNNLEEVNRNRTAAGEPPIDPTDEKMKARYGF